MANDPDKTTEQWLLWAGQVGKSASVVERVVTAGEFLEDVCGLPDGKIRECLSGIDFSKAVQVMRLPKKVYVQYAGSYFGMWFTDTGLTPNLVGLADGRKRKVYMPVGGVRALRSHARSINDTWTARQLFPKLPKEELRKMVQMARGSGVQYIVADKSAMREVPKYKRPPQDEAEK